jgi:hypothetical protein
MGLALSGKPALFLEALLFQRVRGGIGRIGRSSVVDADSTRKEADMRD